MRGTTVPNMLTTRVNNSNLPHISNAMGVSTPNTNNIETIKSTNDTILMASKFFCITFDLKDKRKGDDNKPPPITITIITISE
jgi:hypothetical protein